MKTFKLKNHVDVTILEFHNFCLVQGSDERIMIRSNKEDASKTLLVNLDGNREVKWRFNSMKEENIEPEVLDIMDLLDAPVEIFESKSINEWVKEVHSNSVSKGWWDERPNLPEIIALIHSELSESLEEHRDGKDYFYYSEDGKPEGTAIELVDAIIRIMDYFGSEKIDLEKLIAIKHRYNQTRSYRHGNKKI